MRGRKYYIAWDGDGSARGSVTYTLTRKGRITSGDIRDIIHDLAAQTSVKNIRITNVVEL